MHTLITPLPATPLASWSCAGATRFTPTSPPCAFPDWRAEHGLSLVSPDGHELAWIHHLSELPAEMRALIEAELAGREFMPTIRRICSVSSFATPSTWEVDTDRGPTRFVLRARTTSARMAAPVLLISDNHGIHT